MVLSSIVLNCDKYVVISIFLLVSLAANDTDKKMMQASNLATVVLASAKGGLKALNSIVVLFSQNYITCAL